MYRRIGKRILDLLLSLPALLLLIPLILLVAVLIRIYLGPGVIFRQPRPGRKGKVFTLLKFRTMTDACGPDGAPLPDSVRLTAFGKFLRSTSLDELPSLINVVRGDMSLVGPRPLLVDYLELYTPEQARRHEVPGGITGWAQINGRNSQSWEDRFRFDVWYVENCSLWLDLSIIFRTLAKVVRREGVSAANHATMPRYTRARDEVKVS
ncbi:sugar transferase [Chloroflexales bacterium ZM16-3]|nr:sugar transferase [Chloroflexales bacterium ZM16-3]